MASKKKGEPPWGDLFDGKPIERLLPKSDPMHGGLPDKNALDEQFRRMCRLREYYGIKRSGWYELALTIASGLDRSLTIIDPSPLPSGATAKRWVGAEGQVFVEEIEVMKRHHKAAGREVTDLALLREHQERFPRYQDMSLEVLERGYYRATGYWTVKRRRKTCGA